MSEHESWPNSYSEGAYQRSLYRCEPNATTATQEVQGAKDAAKVSRSYTGDNEHLEAVAPAGRSLACDWVSEHQPLSAAQAIERLCRLQADVYARNTDDFGAADCFCGKSGFWGAAGYDGTFEGGYRNDGKAIEFIERAVREALARGSSANGDSDAR